jgi:hypothetical protein
MIAARPKGGMPTTVACCSDQNSYAVLGKGTSALKNSEMAEALWLGARLG